MKQRRKLRKRTGAFLLAAAILAAGLPQFQTEVYAAEQPDVSQFATKEQLLNSFDTVNSTTDKQGKKVYFGQNGSGSAQAWWIVGSQSDNSIVLFAASSLTNAVFSNSLGEKTYTATGETVYSNHYGASDLFNTLKELEKNTAYFSKNEQNLMINTTVWTKDTRNNKNYSTTGKLYAVYGDWLESYYATVGTNSSSSGWRDGLRIDWSYCVNDSFLSRAPSPYYPDYVLECHPKYGFTSNEVNRSQCVVPAFQLDISSVLFGSTVPAISSDGAITTNDTFTLRYTDSSIGTAAISKSSKCAAISGVSGNTYLVVQNSDGAWAKKVNNGDVIFASELDSSLTSFADCKVWLEKTDSSSRLTYATMTTESSSRGYQVKVNTGENMTVQSGSVLQTNVSGAISSITIKAQDGYYFPSDYSVNSVNGLTVTRISDSEITVSGTPTTDTLLTLTSATQKPQSDTPEISVSQSASSITVNVTNWQSDFGTIQYKWDNDTAWTDTKEQSFTLSNLGANKSRTFSVRFTGQGIYLPSEEKTETIATNAASYEVSIPATTLTAGDSGSTASISVSQSKTFDLGAGGKVEVRVLNNGAVSSDGKLTLTRDKDSSMQTITSAMLVDGSAFTDISKALVTFTMSNYKTESKTISFAQPEEENIAAGTYKGTVTFEISYSE